jgi:hypothetical protein
MPVVESHIGSVDICNTGLDRGVPQAGSSTSSTVGLL